MYSFTYFIKLYTDLDRKFYEMNTRISKRNAEISELQSSYSERKAEISDMDRRISDTDKRISNTDRRISEVQSSLSERKAEISELQSSFSKRKAEISELQSSVSELKFCRDFSLFISAIYDANIRLSLEKKMPCLYNLENANLLPDYFIYSCKDNDDVVNYKLALLRIQLNKINTRVKKRIDRFFKYPDAVEELKCLLDSVLIVSYHDIDKIEIDDDTKEGCLDYWGLTSISDL